ncbi:MAG: hypothetical protein M0R03_06165 [Novosphingobium sp.]|nr:hypothetical protein [Novosphingobium sp.]
MNPSAQEVLKSCVQNLEELVAPELTSPHAKSAMMCARMLINHVILRLDGEGEALAADCREKRALLAQLAQEGTLDADCAAQVAAMLEAPEPEHTSIATLTARDDAWKRLTERVLAGLGDGEPRARIRRQLAAQISRENACCGPAMDGPMF